MKALYDVVRPAIFNGKLTQSQVDGIERLLEAWIAWGDGNIQRLAKVLATATWETGRRMQPVKETTRPSDINVPKDETVIRRLDTAYKKGQLTWVKKPYWKQGWFGRGDVQLTHEANYKGKARDAVLSQFGVDIHKDPSLALRGDISAFILIRGSLEGWFTGKKLSDYIDEKDEPDAQDHAEYMAARRVINGVDRAKEIADLAVIWERGLKAAMAELPRGTLREEPKVAPKPATGVANDNAARTAAWRPGTAFYTVMGVAILVALVWLYGVLAS